MYATKTRALNRIAARESEANAARKQSAVGASMRCTKNGEGSSSCASTVTAARSDSSHTLWNQSPKESAASNVKNAPAKLG